jgi:hypothetical protein
MLARRLTTILPAMTLAEALETTRIHRVAGLTGDRTALVTTRPCRAPHHTISDAELISGGHGPLPGEVSLAHHGMLFLDAWPECRRHVLELLRQPLWESGLTIGEDHALDADAHSKTCHKPEPAYSGPSDERRDHNEYQRGGSGSQTTAGHGNTPRRAVSTTGTRA